MKPGMSSLNPNAASYIPLNQREANNKNKFSELTSEGSLKSGDQNSWSIYPSERHSKTDPNYFLADAASDFNTTCIKGRAIVSDFTRKAEQSTKQYVDEDTEMDLAFMATLFPGISEQSLSDVYSVNGGDVEASIDMLNELELDPVDDSKRLPDSLEIGDVSECRVTAEGSSMKLKSIFSNEASGSSPGPLGSA